ncbi:hypothetical protein [Reinekea sp. G2M2-21]|uniref:hypothetical protein n=1 Tax=Reinekea sp. G2M2-21 TaxID=2788942 RepID=UPI0018A8A9C6|nr:hypothetical protein [Reinekea sp. G2M2-21]
MSETIQIVKKVTTSPTIRQMVFALLVTVLLFAFSKVAPDYLKLAAEAKFGGLVFILYSVWLALIVLWFKAWQMIFHASTRNS